MTEPLSVSAVQEWIDASDISCGECKENSFTILDTMYSSMMEGHFDAVSPHRAKLECDNCGAVTENSLMENVVEDIRS